jgi:hypothetical protein
MKKEITAKDCDEWLKNKNINPITKKKISDTGNIYKNLFNQCDIESKIKNFCTKMKEQLTKDDYKYYTKVKIFCDDIFYTSPSKSSSTPKKKKEKKPSFINIKPKIDISSINSSSLIDVIEKDRYMKYKKITDFLKKIKLGNKSCIVPSNKVNTYTLNNDIGLYKQIGSSSKFGAIYKSININKKYGSKDIPKFVTKIQLVSSSFKVELKILKIIMKLSAKDNIPCIPYIYNIMECNNIINDNRYPKPLQKATKKNKSYSLILYELATGDLRSFFKKDRDYNTWKNCYEQILMSIFVFHSIIGNHHGDTHYGNFLYRKIKPGGCFCYNINGIDYYIENLGYVWMIWDYGNATSIKELSDPTWLDDYKKINLFMRKRDLIIEQSNFFKQYIDKTVDEFHNRFGYLDDNVKITPKIYKLQEDITEHIYYKSYKKEKITPINYLTKFDGIKQDNIITEYQWFKMILDSNLLFSKTPIGEVISTTIFTNPDKFYYTDKKSY